MIIYQCAYILFIEKFFYVQHFVFSSGCKDKWKRTKFGIFLETLFSLLLCTKMFLYATVQLQSTVMCHLTT